MKTFIFAAAALGLVACAQQPDVTFKRITTAEEFNTAIVGKKLVYKGNYAITRADGTVDGTFAGGFTGTWEWVDGFWCRIIEGNADIQVNDCQVFEIAGNQVRNTRDKGAGRTVVYTIEDT